MDLQQYIKDATRTESKIDSLKVDITLLYNTLVIFTMSGQILDQIKKNVFYNKLMSDVDIAVKANAIRYAAGQIKVSAESGIKTIHSKKSDIDPRVFHAIIGIATESTELCEALFDTLFLSEKPIDVVNLLEENGDINWYQAIMIDALGGDWENIMNTNIEKLRERFPDKFTDEDANNRDLDAEREILETLNT